MSWEFWVECLWKLMDPNSIRTEGDVCRGNTRSVEVSVNRGETYTEGVLVPGQIKLRTGGTHGMSSVLHHDFINYRDL